MKLKKMMSCLLSAAVILSLSAGVSASADVTASNGTAPHTVFATFHGDPKTSRGFTWYTNDSGLASQVVYSTQSDLSNPKSITGEASYEVDGGDRNTTDGVTGDGTSMTPSSDAIRVYCHKAVLSDLQPGTKYYYKVGDTAKGLSQEGSFTTENSDNSGFEFIDVTDTQAAFTDSDYYSNWAPLVKKAFQTAPNASFLMDGGDITNNGGDINQWYDFADAAKDQLMNTTFVPVAGNHETYLAKTFGSFMPITSNFANNKGSHKTTACGTYLDAFLNHFSLSLPAGESISSTHQGAYYDFNYGNTLFLVLNTNQLNPDGTLSSEQINWLQSECSNSKQQWKVLTFHRAIQSIGSHIADVDVQALRAQLLTIIAKDGIDLVLQGHDHTYVRSRQIGTNGTPVNGLAQVTETYNGASTVFDVNPKGSVYIINGASNDKLYVDNYNAKGFENASKNVYPAVSNPVKAGTTLDEANDPDGNSVAKLPTYSTVKVTGDRLVVTTYQYNVEDNSQKVLDCYGLAKPDESALIAQINSLKSGDTAAVSKAYSTYESLDKVDQAAVTNSAKLLSLHGAVQTSAFKAPKTGDTTNMMPVYILTGLCLLGLAAIIINERKKKKAEK